MKSSNYWLEHISKWSQSDISQAEYCRREQISFNSFSYRKLKQENAASKPEAVKFIDLSSARTASIELCVSGVTIKLPETIGCNRIAELVKCLS